MSVATDSGTEGVVIYVRLLDEGTTVYRPASAFAEGQGAFRLVATEGYDSEDEHWEFPPGAIVRGELRVLNGSEVLVAVARA
jgi:hypothetical protein